MKLYSVGTTTAVKNKIAPSIKKHARSYFLFMSNDIVLLTITIIPPSIYNTTFIKTAVESFSQQQLTTPN